MAPAWRRGRSQEAVAGRNTLHLTVMCVDDGGRPLPSSTDAMDVDSEDDAGCTALHYAAEVGNAWAVGLLLARGATVNAIDEHGSTPLAQAVLHRHAGVAERLLASAADPLVEDGYGRAPLGYAAQGGCVACLRLLLRVGADASAEDRETSTTPLHVASASSQLLAVQLLLEQGK